MKNNQSVIAWAWEFDGGLCRWALPEKSRLTAQSRPADDAKPVMVRIIKESDYRKLVKNQKAEK